MPDDLNGLLPLGSAVSEKRRVVVNNYYPKPPPYAAVRADEVEEIAARARVRYAQDVATWHRSLPFRARLAIAWRIIR